MTEISFLHGAHDRIQAVAAWLGQPDNGARKVLVFAPLAERRDQLDRLLWTHPPTGFIAHCMDDDRLASETPIVLASKLDMPPHDECLLNLSDEIPPGFSRFRQLIEIVSVDDTDRIPGRERFRFYRERGYPLEARDIAEGIK